MDYAIRNMREDEWPLLEDFLYEAIFVPEGFEGEVPRSVIYDDPKCRAAFDGFGTLPDDRAVVATVDGEVVGACWVRTTDEYGHIDDETPSFSNTCRIVRAPQPGFSLRTCRIATSTPGANVELQISRKHDNYRINILILLTMVERRPVW